MSIDEAKASIAKLFRQDIHLYQEDLSEADTRCKLIDAVLIDGLGWSEASITREPRVQGPKAGYVDYVLYATKAVYVIEAKRSREKFSVPSTRRQRAFKIGGSLSEDAGLIEAIHQCRNYGISKGTSFCCVSNGLQWVFFRGHTDLGIPLEEHQAIVFSDPEDLIANFGQFYELLSHASVVDGGHYRALPVAEVVEPAARFKRLSSQSHRLRYRDRNRLEPFIRDVVSEVFQDLASEDADLELIEQCYVESPSQGSYEQSLRALLKNRPTLADGKIEPVRVSRRTAGKFDSVLDAVSSARQRPAEVAMLLGGIGSGKTTLLGRFRKVIAREKIDQHCLWVNVNFNKYTDSPGDLDRWVASEIQGEAEKNFPEIEFGSYAHLRQAYHAEYERLKVGRLKPVYETDPVLFEQKFSEHLGELEKQAIPHVVRLLRAIQRQRGRRVFLVFDNADQFSSALQNDVFMLANRLATEVSCSVIVSLREESFWKNKDHGALSAFHGASFYVEAPDLKQVVAKRFRYATELLASSNAYVVPSGGFGITHGEGIKVFNSIRDSVLEDPRFIEFLAELSPGEVRRPLDQLARFLLSGHTNLDAVIRGVRTHKQIGIKFHEFVKSVSLGDRETFDEEKSDIINLFALDGGIDASNLNRLAMLGLIHSFRTEVSERGVGYVAVERVLDVCASNGISSDTANIVLRFLNARRIIESDEQRRDAVGMGQYVRTTRAFKYYIEKLGPEFAYVDLVIPGTLVAPGEYFHMIERLSAQIYATGAASLKRIERIEMRIERARRFAVFMAEEASRHAMFRAGAVHDLVVNYVNSLDRSIAKQGPLILESAKRAFASGREGSGKAQGMG